VNPDVAETAALAHDLGHPPFGHVAEETLDGLVRDEGFTEGFNGNAQSFRIVTKLTQRGNIAEGLDLTAASLDGILKYPWRRGSSGVKSEKWGAYRSEKLDFRHARSLHAPNDRERSVEAEIMDWADDVAYSVHDVEDFFRAGLIPLDRLADSSVAENDVTKTFLDSAMASPRIPRLSPTESDSSFRGRLAASLSRALDTFPLAEAYDESLLSQAGLSQWKSQAIERYIEALALCDPARNKGKRAHIPIAQRELGWQVQILKELTWFFVINNARTATQRVGQRNVIKTLFKSYCAALKHHPEVLPVSTHDRLKARKEGGRASPEAQNRAIVDLIASMTERQAVTLYRQMTGVSAESVLAAQPV